MHIEDLANTNLVNVWPNSVGLSQAAFPNLELDGFEFLKTRFGEDRLVAGVSLLDVGAGTTEFLSEMRSNAAGRGYTVNPFAVDYAFCPEDFRKALIPAFKGDLLDLPDVQNGWPNEFDIVNANAFNAVPSPGQLLKLIKICAQGGIIIMRYAVGEGHHERELVNTLQSESVFSKRTKVFYRPDLRLSLQSFPQGSRIFPLGPAIFIKKVSGL